MQYMEYEKLKAGIVSKPYPKGLDIQMEGMGFTPFISIVIRLDSTSVPCASQLFHSRFYLLC